ncbi:N-formylglutamate deformylase [Puniceibacterium sp. IMCC21224]|uniref:N-formylglutamate deformylase n=1 Tax=Puniceibacterium sp. IMCC21224 TaxID=1618204 RepID=UPI00064DC19A|nr:N-formylglutamate deformylase [Puniceibacterium sp. IMCC21224]KMK66830.1 N-formylglutamate amidohydrolase [Puniceibacterium sp. IMCC21224]
MTPVDVTRGDSPVILGLPHTGTHVPDDIMAQLNPLGRTLADTDWHIHQLYDGLLPGVTTVRATFHRYVIDANRDPSGQSLYPGQNTTGLVPLTDFEGEEIWNSPPDAAEISLRRDTWHTPYHAALAAEVVRVHARHGVAILYDCHSIRGNIPFLFDGTLPDFNIGTNDGLTCAPEIAAATSNICTQAQGYTAVTNGRFKGGWTTRHYGRPTDGVHAIQMELAQSAYLTDECAPWAYDTPKSDRLRVHLREILTTLAQLAPSLGGTR